MLEKSKPNLSRLFETLNRKIDISFLTNLVLNLKYFQIQIRGILGLDRIATSKNFNYTPSDSNDLIKFYSWFSQSIKLYPYLFEAGPTPKELRGYQAVLLRHIQNENSHVISIFNKNKNEIAGCIKLLSLTDEDHIPEVYKPSDFMMTIFLSPESIKSKKRAGIGTEAIRSMLEFVLNKTEKKRVILRVDYRNSAALKCYLKCGFMPYIKDPNIRNWSKIIRLCREKNNPNFPNGLITMAINRKMIRENIDSNYDTTNFFAKSQFELYFNALKEVDMVNP